MLSKCIKMPKYSFIHIYFLPYGGCPSLILAYHPHLTCITLATPRIVLAAPCIVSAAPRILSAALCFVLAVQSMTRNIWSTSKFF